MAARADDWKEERLYKLYITDSLRAIGQLDARWADLIRRPIEEKRTGAEIANGIKEKLEGL